MRAYSAFITLYCDYIMVILHRSLL